MGLIVRMNIASHFLHKYIMPLANFMMFLFNYQDYLQD